MDTWWYIVLTYIHCYTVLQPVHGHLEMHTLLYCIATSTWTPGDAYITILYCDQCMDTWRCIHYYIAVLRPVRGHLMIHTLLYCIATRTWTPGDTTNPRSLTKGISLGSCRKTWEREKYNDIIVWQRFCEPARLRIAYCWWLAGWGVWHLPLTDMHSVVCSFVY